MSEGKSAYAEKLDKMRGGFQTAEKTKGEGGSQVLHEGIYVGRVTAKLGETKAGDIKVNRMFVPTEGDYAGCAGWDGINIGHSKEDVAMRAKRELIRFLDVCNYQFDASRPEELEDVLEALTTEAPIVKFEARVTTSDDGREFNNMSVLELIGRSQNSSQGKRVEPEVPASEEQIDPKVTQIRKFLTEQGVEIPDEATGETKLVEVMQGYEFKFPELSPADVEMLESYDLGDNILGKPAPKATAKPKVKAKVKPTGKAKRH